MTRKEAERLARQSQVLQSLGFTAEEAEKLRRISMTLHRWHELECGTDAGCIERDGENGDGKPFMTYARGNLTRGRYPIADRERGAKKRLSKIIEARNTRAFAAVHSAMQGYAPEWAREQELSTFIQTDPRGAALYILRPSDIPAGADVSGYYSRGICVY